MTFYYVENGIFGMKYETTVRYLQLWFNNYYDANQITYSCRIKTYLFKNSDYIILRFFNVKK